MKSRFPFVLQRFFNLLNKFNYKNPNYIVSNIIILQLFLQKVNNFAYFLQLFSPKYPTFFRIKRVNQCFLRNPDAVRAQNFLENTKHEKFPCLAFYLIHQYEIRNGYVSVAIHIGCKIILIGQCALTD